MQRSILSALLPRLPLGVREFATASADYSIAMKKAAEITGAAESAMGPKEGGFTAGVPLDTFTRKVRGRGAAFCLRTFPRLAPTGQHL